MTFMANATTRLIAAHLLLVALSTAAALGFVYWKAGGVIDAEARQVVEAEIQGLAADHARGGVAELARAIALRLESRQARGANRDAVYLLASPSGRTVAGNLASWPGDVEPGSGWVTLDLFRVDDSRPTTISGLSVSLPGGERLLVGRDVAARAAFDAALTGALIWALAATLALAVVTGWLLSRLVLSRIDDIGATAREIMGGALDRRIPLRGADDEFDRLAQTLNAMLDRIAGLVGDLRTVTDSLAHDIRSPLGRLTRHLEAALDPDAPADTHAAQIARAQAEAQIVLAMSSALLEISRVEAGIGTDQFVALDLAAVAHDLAELYACAAEERGAALICRADAAVTIVGHPQLLAQAVSNLIENALAHAAGTEAIMLSVAIVGGSPTLSVADRGPGVPEADHARVLERFTRLDAARNGGGAGLGLALAAAVAKMHGAAITLSDNAPGLVVTLQFPSQE